ncbi:MAG: hypothetical protein ACYDG6_09590 [Thermincolia bacterium]
MFIMEIMMIVAMAVFAYVMLIAFQQKHIGYLVVMLAVFAVVGVLVETITPIIRDAEIKAEEIERKFERFERFIR